MRDLHDFKANPLSSLRTSYGKFLALIAGVALLISAAQPARAGITDCLLAIAPVEQAGELVALTAAVATCGSKASSDPAAAGVTALIVALGVAGAFNNTDQCNALIDSVVGKVVAEALGALNVVDADKVQQFLEGKISFSQIPGSEVITQYTQCACTVAGAPGEAKKIADEYAAIVDGCVGFLGDVGKAAEDFWDSGPLGDNGPCFIDCPQAGVPLAEEGDKIFEYCPAGWAKTAINPHIEMKEQTNNGITTEYEYWDKYTYDFTPRGCTCGQPASETWKIVGDPPQFGSLACKCPAGQGYKQLAGTIAGSKVMSGPSSCETCGPNQIVNKNYQCESCPAGMVKSPYYNTCMPACNNAPGTVWNYVTNASTGKDELGCFQCKAGTKAVHPVAGNNYGYCQPCEWGKKSADGADACTDVCAAHMEPINDLKGGVLCYPKCKGGKWDSWKGCVACAENEGSVYGKNTCQKCPKDAKVENGVCVCQKKGYQMLGATCFPSPDTLKWTPAKSADAKLPEKFDGVCGPKNTDDCVFCGVFKVYSPDSKQCVFPKVENANVPPAVPNNTKIGVPNSPCPRGFVMTANGCATSLEPITKQKDEKAYPPPSAKPPTNLYVTPNVNVAPNVNPSQNLRGTTVTPNYVAPNPNQQNLRGTKAVPNTNTAPNAKAAPLYKSTVVVPKAATNMQKTVVAPRKSNTPPVTAPNQTQGR